MEAFILIFVVLSLVPVAWVISQKQKNFEPQRKFNRHELKIYKQAQKEWRKNHPQAAAQLLESIQMYREAISILEGQGLIHEAARVLLRLGSHDRAGLIYARNGVWDKAAECYLHADIPLEAAKCMRELGQFQQAADYFLKAGKLIDAAMCFEKMGDYKKAVRIYVDHGMKKEAIRIYKLLSKSSSQTQSSRIEAEAPLEVARGDGGGYGSRAHDPSSRAQSRDPHEISPGSFDDEDLQNLESWVIEGHSDEFLTQTLSSFNRLGPVIFNLIISGKSDAAMQLVPHQHQDLLHSLFALSDELKGSVEKMRFLALFFHNMKSTSFAANLFERAQLFKDAAPLYEELQNFGKASYCFERAGLTNDVQRIKPHLDSETKIGNVPEIVEAFEESESTKILVPLTNVTEPLLEKAEDQSAVKKT